MQTTLHDYRRCTCMLMDIIFCHVMFWKHWHPRRKVKAKKNQSLLNNRVGLHPSHFYFIFDTFPEIHFSVSTVAFSLSSVNNMFPNFTAADADNDDDMFKPPNLDNDDFSPFGGKSGLFSGGRGLFDDDEVRRCARHQLSKLAAKTFDTCLPTSLPGWSVLRRAKTSCGWGEKSSQWEPEECRYDGMFRRREKLWDHHPDKSTWNGFPLLDSDKAGKKILAGAVSVFPGIQFRRPLSFPSHLWPSSTNWIPSSSSPQTITCLLQRTTPIQWGAKGTGPPQRPDRLLRGAPAEAVCLRTRTMKITFSVAKARRSPVRVVPLPARRSLKLWWNSSLWHPGLSSPTGEGQS